MYPVKTRPNLLRARVAPKNVEFQTRHSPNQGTLAVSLQRKVAQSWPDFTRPLLKGVR